MTMWFRTYHADEDLWLYFEADDEGWAARQVEVRGQDSRPVTAASLRSRLTHRLRRCVGWRMPRSKDRHGFQDHGVLYVP